MDTKRYNKSRGSKHQNLNDNAVLRLQNPMTAHLLYPSNACLISETGFGEEIQTLPGTTNQPSPPLLLLLSVVVVVVVVAVGLSVLPVIVGLSVEVELNEDWERLKCKKNARSSSWNFIFFDGLH